MRTEGTFHPQGCSSGGHNSPERDQANASQPQLPTDPSLGMDGSETSTEAVLCRAPGLSARGWVGGRGGGPCLRQDAMEWSPLLGHSPCREARRRSSKLLTRHSVIPPTLPEMASEVKVMSYNGLSSEEAREAGGENAASWCKTEPQLCVRK